MCNLYNFTYFSNEATNLSNLEEYKVITHIQFSQNKKGKKERKKKYKLKKVGSGLVLSRRVGAKIYRLGLFSGPIFQSYPKRK